MKITTIEEKNSKEEELYEVIKKNIQVAAMMKSEIERLNIEKVNQDSLKKQPDISTNPKTDYDHSSQTVNQDFEDEVNYYLEEIKKISYSQDMEEQIKEILPTQKNYHYQKIDLRIQAELLKIIKEINELIMAEEDSMTIEDLQEFKEEIKENQAKIKIISKLQKITNIQEQTVERNHLIFVPTENGNIRLLEELKKIDSTYYEGFKGLLESIKDGSFKNVKRFERVNRKMSGVSEVKDFKIRVVFDRIGPHDYAIISAFVKKSDMDKSYAETLQEKIYYYRRQANKLKQQLNDDEFRAMNQRTEEEIYRRLKNQKEMKILKKGEIHD